MQKEHNARHTQHSGASPSKLAKQQEEAKSRSTSATTALAFRQDWGGLFFFPDPSPDRAGLHTRAASQAAHLHKYIPKARTTIPLCFQQLCAGLREQRGLQTQKARWTFHGLVSSRQHTTRAVRMLLQLPRILHRPFFLLLFHPLQFLLL